MSDEKPPAVPQPDGPPPVPGVEIFDGAEAPSAGLGPPTPPGPQLAHPALRALAFAMDGIGTVILTVVVVFAGLQWSYGTSFFGILVVPFLSALLSTVLTAIYGVTPSKAILGITVVDAETGAPIGWRSILRSLVVVAPIALGVIVTWASYFLPYQYTSGMWSIFGVTLLPSILGWVALLVVLAVSPRFRGLQDRAGHSIVVRR